jgi:hypothetical protein
MQRPHQGQRNQSGARLPHGSRQRSRTLPGHQATWEGSDTTAARPRPAHPRRGGWFFTHTPARRDPAGPAGEIENLATLPQDSPAIIALRSWIIARFTELETERTEINERLAALDRATGQDDEPGLLDALPMLGDALPSLPTAIQARLFAAFGWN